MVGLRLDGAIFANVLRQFGRMSHSDVSITLIFGRLVRAQDARPNPSVEPGICHLKRSSRPVGPSEARRLLRRHLQPPTLGSRSPAVISQLQANEDFVLYNQDCIRFQHGFRDALRILDKEVSTAYASGRYCTTVRSGSTFGQGGNDRSDQGSPLH